MQRLLILLLVLVVPLKAWASAALPLYAGMKHASSLTLQHVGQMAHAHGDHRAQSDHEASCPDHDAGPHSHDCPHLTMPLLVPATLPRTIEPGAAERPAVATPSPLSVVLDVLLPPPLLLS